MAKSTPHQQTTCQLTAEPITSLERPVSPIEYYHASVGTSEKTLERPRECILMMPCAGTIDKSELEAAIAAVAAVNPGVRLRWHGKGRKAKWRSDGQLPSVRLIENSIWDVESSDNSEFLYEVDLDVMLGLTTELIIVRGKVNALVLRTLHAIMDGFGMLHFLQEVFRALRGEPLLGSNTEFSDFDLIRTVPSRKPKEKRNFKPAYSTGGPKGSEKGDYWQVFKLPAIPQGALVNAMQVVAECAARYSDAPCVIALPISLRRHEEGIRAPGNFASMIHITVMARDSAANISDKIRTALDGNYDAAFPDAGNWLKILPLTWLDRLLSRSEKNYTKRQVIETAVISKLGYFTPEAYSCPGFTPERLYTIPVEGNTMISISAMGDNVSVTVGMERVYASEGRFEVLYEALKTRLAQQIPALAKVANA